MEYYADSFDVMTGAIAMMRSFRHDVIVPRIRHEAILRVLPHALQATCKHEVELAVPFIRFVWETMEDPHTLSDGPPGAMIARWHTQCNEVLVNGGAVELLVRMTGYMQPYLEHSTRDEYPISKAKESVRGLMFVLSVFFENAEDDGTSNDRFRNLSVLFNEATEATGGFTFPVESQTDDYEFVYSSDNASDGSIDL